MKRLIVPFTTLFLCLCCCPYAPFARDLTTVKPNVQDIVGTYQVTSQNLDIEGMGAFIDHDPQIHLNKDGSCMILDFPIWEDLPPFTITDWQSLSGEWDIVTTGGVDLLEGYFDTWGVQCIGETDEMKTADLIGDKAPYKLLFVYGDPDSNEIMTFSKTNKSGYLLLAPRRR
jgi:hypothetical protein